MKEKRAEVIKECTLKESAAINQILGKMVRMEVLHCKCLYEGSYDLGIWCDGMDCQKSPFFLCSFALIGTTHDAHHMPMYGSGMP